MPGEQGAEEETAKPADPPHGGRHVEPVAAGLGWCQQLLQAVTVVVEPVVPAIGSQQDAATLCCGWLCCDRFKLQQPSLPGRPAGLQGRNRSRSLPLQQTGGGCQLTFGQLVGHPLLWRPFVAIEAEGHPQQLAHHDDGEPEAEQDLPEQAPLEDHASRYPMLRTVSMPMASPARACSFWRMLQMCTSTLRS